MNTPYITGRCLFSFSTSSFIHRARSLLFTRLGTMGLRQQTAGLCGSSFKRRQDLFGGTFLKEGRRKRREADSLLYLEREKKVHIWAFNRATAGFCPAGHPFVHPWQCQRRRHTYSSD
jgi:hypothetical protein